MSEQDRIDRFEACYNRIDRQMDELVGTDTAQRRRPFARKVRIAADRQRRLQQHKDFLLEVGELRNAMVHNRTGDDRYLAVPSEATVAQLELIEQRLFSPDRVLPTFQRDIIVLEPQHTLAHALHRIRDDGYARYPVYGEEGFIGLLTTNGITRWIASRVDNSKINIDASAVLIEEVMDADHRKDSVIFVGRNALVDDVVQLFADHKPLEAVIITEHGRLHQHPLGMACPMDVAAVES